ncbi:MAG: phosphoglycerol geranylgeranyltransferase [Thermoplasmatales archaeon]|nr:phosphoglycerol geranylgeranyltransferase [Thermoplasmatales archaeon]
MNLIDELLQKYKKVHFSLIDPDSQTPEEAGEIAKVCEEFGTNAIMVGGSTVRNRKMVYDAIEAIKKNVRLPIILFPNSAGSISENVEYLLFMILLNSKGDKYRFEEQAKGAPLIKKWGIQPISTGYIVVSTSREPTTIERNVELDKIHTNDIEKAVEYAVYAEITGLSCVYFDAGSGAEIPISNEMIQAIRENINIPLIVGGGIRDEDTAKEKIDAGADIIVNGTVVEQDIKIIGDIVKKIQTSSFDAEIKSVA